ncbi:MAG: ribosomal protein S18-alanine N-acetyltransferase [Bifidobacteriaceae bacterium]|jgi:ribosomal-protein-alanine N-acetyltransferase|nr:ribosomal protein S18-alanine N-acetyltransferase [Bifidobacteriaceae bacterium]
MPASGVRLRRVEASDVPALVRIERETFAGEAWSEPMVRDEVNGPTRHYIVAEWDGEVVGYAGVFLGDTPDIMTVGVLPAARRQGIGRTMTQDLINVAVRAGARTIFLEVREDNAPAIGLYTSLGFVPVRTRRHYYGPDIHATVMSLELPPPPPAAPPPPSIPRPNTKEP